MLKPPMPGMTDTLEFVKNLWGGMHIPGAMPGMTGVPGMPPLPGAGMSVEDLDKKIADLKAVESWLTLNQNMLHGSIQALEIQRGTLATLKAMGDSMAQAMGQSNVGESSVAPFAQFFAQMAQAATPAASTQTTPTPPTPTPPPPAPAPEAAQAVPDATGAAMPAAVAWWNLLQDQFRQAVTSTMPAEGTDGAAAPSSAPDAPAAEPATRARRNGRSKADKP
ncbi:PhaM family polyhydroxyalkanoate granule multifunctional regulatory protein [Massilia aurea]|uniref:PhaM family polyhydroxyalkanoate granule multifunctional regulatory protein n=1 Tax=Massilia aurea TaxID=373040 RepID=UPI003462D341